MVCAISRADGIVAEHVPRRARHGRPPRRWSPSAAPWPTPSPRRLRRGQHRLDRSSCRRRCRPPAPTHHIRGIRRTGDADGQQLGELLPLGEFGEIVCAAIALDRRRRRGRDSTLQRQTGAATPLLLTAGVVSFDDPPEQAVATAARTANTTTGDFRMRSTLARPGREPHNAGSARYPPPGGNLRKKPLRPARRSSMPCDLMLIAYDGSENAKRAIEYAGRFLTAERAILLTAWEPMVRQAARMSGTLRGDAAGVGARRGGRGHRATPTPKDQRRGRRTWPRLAGIDAEAAHRRVHDHGLDRHREPAPTSSTPTSSSPVRAAQPGCGRCCTAVSPTSAQHSHRPVFLVPPGQ